MESCSIMWRLLGLLLTVLAAVEADPGLLRNTILARARSTDKKPPNIRLPTTLKPVEYTISLVPFVGINATFDGHVEILFKVISPTNEITLHNTGSTVTSVGVRGEREVKVTGTREDAEREFYVITVGEELEGGREYRVTIAYVGELSDDTVGMYLAPYSTTTSDHEQRWSVATQLQAVHARSVFPCFDEPAMKAVFKIKVSRPGNMFTLSNMPQLGEPTKHVDTPDGVGRFWDEFEPTPVMSTYLVAIVVSDFENVADTKSKLRVFSQPSGIAQVDYCLRLAPKILEVLREYTGRDEVMPKTDVVALQRFRYDAMENWGLITFRDDFMLVEEGVTRETKRGETAYLLGHEFAHYWFGNLVTLDWWDNVWLNEGFATYMAYFAVGKVDASWRMEEMFVLEKTLTSMEQDAALHSRPMTYAPETNAGIIDVFDVISYGKGAAVIRMMSYMISAKTFQAGLQDYLNNRSFNTSTPDILFTHLGNKYREHNPADKLDLKAVMTSWTTQMGYPLVTVKRDYGASSARITQERFLQVRNATASRGYKWFVPLTFATQRAPHFENTTTAEWLEPKTPELVIRQLSATADEWVLFNVQFIGFYRVNYDTKNWYLLAAYLDSDNFETIPPLNRAQLIEDAFKLAMAGHVSHCVPLLILRYIKRETDYVPLKAAFDCFELLDRKFRFTQDFQNFQKFMNVLVSPVYARLGLAVKDSDDHVTLMAREAVAEWACWLNDTQCSRDAVEAFRRFQKSSVPLNPNVQWTVVCIAARDNHAEVMPFLLKRKRDPKTTFAEETFIQKVLWFCTKESQGRAKLLARLKPIDSSLRLQRFLVDSSPGRSVEDDDVILDYFLEHHEEILKTLGPSVRFGEALSKYVPYIVSRSQVVKLEKFMRALRKDQRRERSDIQAAIDGSVSVRQWVEKTNHLYVAWMKAEVEGAKGERDCALVNTKLRPQRRPDKAGSGRTHASSGLYTGVMVVSLVSTLGCLI